MAAIEQRYAAALDRLAAESKADAAGLERELDAIADLIGGHRELAAVLASPAVTFAAKRGLLDALAKRMRLSTMAHNFLLVAVQRGRANNLEGIARAFEAMRLERSGVVLGEVVSARELSADERKALEAELSALVKRTLRPVYRQDAGLLGGFTAKVGDQVFDGSISGRLQRLRQILAEA